MFDHESPRYNFCCTHVTTMTGISCWVGIIECVIIAIGCFPIHEFSLELGWAIIRSFIYCMGFYGIKTHKPCLLLLLLVTDALECICSILLILAFLLDAQPPCSITITIIFMINFIFDLLMPNIIYKSYEYVKGIKAEKNINFV